MKKILRIVAISLIPSLLTVFLFAGCNKIKLPILSSSTFLSSSVSSSAAINSDSTYYSSSSILSSNSVNSSSAVTSSSSDKASGTSSKSSSSLKSSSSAKSSSSKTASSKASSSSKPSSSSSPVSTSQPSTGSNTYKPLAFDEMRGLWVATAWGADFPRTTTASGQENELKALVDNAKSAGLNTIFFQVRGWSDAFYKSNYYPWSAYITGTQGKSPTYDPLGYLIDYAHSKGIAVEAWINPYRISSVGSSKTTPCSTNPASVHSDWVVTYTYGSTTNKIFNPGLSEVRDYITNGVTEIVKNYNVDGIVFDDYFYPDPSASFNDTSAYNQYKSGGGSLSLADWRRDNVNKLISQVHTAVHQVNSNVDFGVAPFGIWQNIPQKTKGSQSYFAQSADTKKWVENHWVDYIAPQLYWGFNSTAAPFAPLCDWWAALCKANNVKLYVALDSTIVENNAAWVNSSGQNEVQYARTKAGYSGAIYFHSAELSNMLTNIKGLY